MTAHPTAALTIDWLRPTAHGALGLSAGMTANEIAAIVGELRASGLHNPALRRHEQLAKLPDGTLTELSCITEDERLIELQAIVKLYAAAPKRSIVDAIAAALDGVASVATPKRKWTADTATFQLTASSDDVLEEGMPIDIQLTVRWGS